MDSATEELRRQHIKTLEVLRRFADENARLREAAPCDAVALEKALLRPGASRGLCDTVCDCVRDMLTANSAAQLATLVRAFLDDEVAAPPLDQPLPCHPT